MLEGKTQKEVSKPQEVLIAEDDYYQLKMTVHPKQKCAVFQYATNKLFGMAVGPKYDVKSTWSLSEDELRTALPYLVELMKET